MTVVLLLNGFVANSFAHVTETIDKEAGDYIISVGYDPFTLSAGSSEPLNFSIRKKDKDEEVDFTSVWVTIVQKDKTSEFGNTLFAAGLAKSFFGPISLTQTFPKEGEYEVNISFRKDDKTLAEAKIPIKVPKSEERESTKPPILGVAIGIFIGVAIGFFLALFIYKKRGGDTL